MVNCTHSGSENESLVTVITRSEIPIPEGFRHGQLGHFLPIPEYAKLRLPGQNLLTAQQARFPADTPQTVVCKDFIPEVLEGYLGFRAVFPGYLIFHNRVQLSNITTV